MQRWRIDWSVIDGEIEMHKNKGDSEYPPYNEEELYMADEVDIEISKLKEKNMALMKVMESLGILIEEEYKNRGLGILEARVILDYEKAKEVINEQ